MHASAFDGLTLTLALATGAFAILISRHLRAPGIILLLLTGIALGPDGLSWIHPEGLGDALRSIVSMAVAVILFEGGLNLKIDQLRRRAKSIRRLITTGAIITAIGGAIVVRLIMGWDWQTSILFGTLIIVTGPTVVTPLLRRIKVKRPVSVVLEAEGILIDPIGAVIAVVCLDFVISGAVNPDRHIWYIAVGSFGLKLGIGLIAGLVTGFVIGWLLRHDEIIPDDMGNILTLAWVLLINEISNYFLPESGLMTVTVAGMVVGNLKTSRERELIEFNEQLVTLLIGMLFILLAADVRLADVKALGVPSLLVVAAIMFVVRPINVFLCTINTPLTWRDRIFMCWLAPRGIVAAAVASLFAYDLAEAGLPGGEQLRGMVFMVIAATVILQGFTAGPLATLLQVRQKRDHGFVLVGANPLGRLLAKLLAHSGEPVVLIDRNDEDCTEAQNEGLQVVYGNALEERNLLRAEIGTRRAAIAITPNDGVNIMALHKAEILERDITKYTALHEGSELSAKQRADLRARLVFGLEIDFDLWIHRLRHDQTVLETWTYQGEQPTEAFEAIGENDQQALQNVFLIMTVRRKKIIMPFYRSLSLQKGDEVTVLVARSKADELHRWLEPAGFQEAPAALPKEDS